MLTPGNIKLVDKATIQAIPATGLVDGGTLLWFNDPTAPFNGSSLALPVGETTCHLQVTCEFSSTVSYRPTWVQVELVRIKGSVYDTTGKSRRAVIQPGTTTWADTFSVEETVDPDDGAFGWTITHNGSGGIKATSRVFKAPNANANIIHRLGGFNRWSDGAIR